MKINPSDGRLKRTYHLESYQVQALKTLSAETRVKQVDFIREAVDDLIIKYRHNLPRDLTKNAKQELYGA